MLLMPLADGNITQHHWEPNRTAFEPFSTECFVRGPTGWTPE